MDPTRLDPALWGQVHHLTGSLASFLGFMVLGAFALLLGHAVIPSLVASGRLPASVRRQRPLFYALAVAAFGLAAFQSQQWVRLLHQVISQVFPRWVL